MACCDYVCLRDSYAVLSQCCVFTDIWAAHFDDSKRSLCWRGRADDDRDTGTDADDD